MARIRVILVDDHALFRMGIRALLQTVPEIEVVAEGGTGVEAVKLADLHRPDIVLMDILMPELNGLDATARIIATHPDIRVLVLSMHDGEDYVYHAFQNGASGYLQKNASPAELELAVKSIARGNNFVGSSISKCVTDEYIGRVRENGCSASRLTLRQREVLQLIVEGYRTKEIARKLGITSKTVEMHRAQTMLSLKIHDVPGLVRYAIRAGMISAH